MKDDEFLINGQALPPLLEVGRELLHVLNEAGYEAYFVGGAVRDYLLHRPIHDVDITTNALPDEVVQLFPAVIPTGMAHGTVTVRWKGFSFEVTTFRTEGEYLDHRHPAAVQFVHSLTEDLARRDLTINAMAMDGEGKLYDPYGGREDLQNRLLRAVGDPQQRFAEDALRMIRVFRFQSQYQFQIEETTLQGIKAERGGLPLIAAERIADEFCKLLRGPGFLHALQLLAQFLVLQHPRLPILEKLVKHPPAPFLQRRIDSLHFLAEEPMDPLILRLLILGHMATLSEAEFSKLGYELFLPRETRRLLTSSYGLLSEWIEEKYAENHWKAEWLDLPQECIAYTWAAYWICGKLSKGEQEIAELGSANLHELYQSERSQWQRFYEELPIRHSQELQLDGNLLLQLIPVAAGPWIARRLEQLVLAVHMGHLKNDREELCHFLQQGYAEELQIREHLHTEWLGHQLYVLPVVDSTQREAQRLWKKGGANGTVVVAQHQTAGRGTRGRIWHSPPQSGAWFSMLLQLPIDLKRAPIITLLTAVALYETLLNWCQPEQLQIKWPNDLLLAGKKCAGILTELHHHDEHGAQLVIGVGVNLNQEHNDFPMELQEHATSLAMGTGEKVQPSLLIALFLAKMEEWLALYQQEGNSAVLHAWTSYAGMIGQRVMTQLEGKDTNVIIHGLDEQGRLLLLDKQGTIHTLVSGEIRLNP